MRKLPGLLLLKAVGVYLAMILLIGGCQPITPAPASPTPPAPPPATQAAPTPLPSATAAALAPAKEHRIGIRVVDGIGEFYDRVSGERFIPRGYNYIHTAPMSASNPQLWHSTLNPGFYDSQLAQESLQAMHQAGYNIVRIFIDCCREGNNAGDPNGDLSQPYLDNTLDFLMKADAAEMYVLMVMDLTPAQGPYGQMWGYCCTLFDGENLRYLTPGGNTAESRFNSDFIHALFENDAPIEMIFAYDLNNEVHFSFDKPPLSLSSGQVKTANGQIYDMARAEDKQRMLDENLVYWIDRQRKNIQNVDPTALVTASFPAIGLNAGFDVPSPAVFQSTMDFVELHTYLGWGRNFTQYMSAFHFEDNPQKPVIMGEFGVSSRAYQDIDQAAEALVSWQVESCKFGFDGWLFWTYNVVERGDLWNGTSDEGQIDRVLSPVIRPDPCK